MLFSLGHSGGVGVCSTLQHTATHCNTLQHTATHCNTLQHAATLCNTLQHSAARCNAQMLRRCSQCRSRILKRQRVAVCCSILKRQRVAVCCSVLQHSQKAACCSVLQCVAAFSKGSVLFTRLSKTTLVLTFKNFSERLRRWSECRYVDVCKSTSNQSSKPCTVLQYPSTKVHICRCMYI